MLWKYVTLFLVSKHFASSIITHDVDELIFTSILLAVYLYFWPVFRANVKTTKE
jgi:hypothetical protein